MVKALADRLAEVSILSECSIYTSNLQSYSCSWQLKLYLSYAIYRALISMFILFLNSFKYILLEKSEKSMYSWTPQIRTRVC